MQLTSGSSYLIFEQIFDSHIQVSCEVRHKKKQQKIVDTTLA